MALNVHLLIALLAFGLSAQGRIGQEDKPILKAGHGLKTNYSRIKDVCDLFARNKLLLYPCEAEGIGTSSTKLVFKEPCSTSIRIAYDNLGGESTGVKIQQPTARGIVSEDHHAAVVEVVNMFSLKSAVPSNESARQFFETCSAIKNRLNENLQPQGQASESSAPAVN